MNHEHKTRNGFRVIGPNSVNGKIEVWSFLDFEKAREFAEVMAKDVDAEYNIYRFVGIVRQVPLEPRPLEFIGWKEEL